MWSFHSCALEGNMKMKDFWICWAWDIDHTFIWKCAIDRTNIWNRKLKLEINEIFEKQSCVHIFKNPALKDYPAPNPPLLSLFSCSVMSDSLQLYGLYPARLRCPWDFSQARILQWGVFSYSRGSSHPRDPQPSSPVSWFFTLRSPQILLNGEENQHPGREHLPSNLQGVNSLSQAGPSLIPG